MKVLLLLPDTIKNPFGGMGVQADSLTSNSRIEYTVNELKRSSIFVKGELNIVINLIEQIENFPKGEYDIVHSFDFSTYLQGKAFSKMYDIPHVHTVQLAFNEIGYTGELMNVANTIEAESFITPDSVIYVSMEYLNKYGGLTENAYYMPNGIDLHKWITTPKQEVKLPGRPNAKKLCYIGRYAIMKNVLSLLQADIPEDVDVYFIGSHRGADGNIYDTTRQVIDKTDNFYFLGAKYGDNKINYLREMDAVIVPSTHEPFGIVCLEALASDSILLSSMESGMGEYLDEEVAINCGTTPESISAGIKKWLSLGKKEKTNMILKGRELCKILSEDRMRSYIENIYKETLSRYNKNAIVEKQIESNLLN